MDFAINMAVLGITSVLALDKLLKRTGCSYRHFDCKCSSCLDVHMSRGNSLVGDSANNQRSSAGSTEIGRRYSVDVPPKEQVMS